MIDLRIKRGVIFIGNVWTERMLEATKIVWASHGLLVLRITSCLDPTHAPTSSHYEGRALDFGITRDSSLNDILARDLQSELGSDFYVELESNHIHCQVKRGVTP